MDTLIHGMNMPVYGWTLSRWSWYRMSCRCLPMDYLKRQLLFVGLWEWVTWRLCLLCNKQYPVHLVARLLVCSLNGWQFSSRQELMGRWGLGKWIGWWISQTLNAIILLFLSSRLQQRTITQECYSSACWPREVCRLRSLGRWSTSVFTPARSHKQISTKSSL